MIRRLIGLVLLIALCGTAWAHDAKFLCFVQTYKVKQDLTNKYGPVQVMTDPSWTARYYDVLGRIHWHGKVALSYVIPFEIVKGSDAVMLYDKPHDDGSVWLHGMFVNSETCDRNDQPLDWELHNEVLRIMAQDDI